MAQDPVTAPYAYSWWNRLTAALAAHANDQAIKKALHASRPIRGSVARHELGNLGQGEDHPEGVLAEPKVAS
jgi:hypothetical protein